MNWITPDPCLNRLQFEFSTQLERRQRANPDCFPGIRGDQELVIAADYSGEHQSSRYDVITFVLADRPGVLELWDFERQLIRNEFLSGNRRHSFKNLGDGQRQRALLPFLRASSKINGITLGVGIDKSIGNSLIGFEIPELNNDNYKPNVLAKLVRSAFFGSILVAGLAREDQSLKWITDDDSIVCNAKTQQRSFSLIELMLRQCCPFELREVTFGIASKFDDNYRAEDLCSIPDLVGMMSYDTAFGWTVASWAFLPTGIAVLQYRWSWLVNPVCEPEPLKQISRDSIRTLESLRQESFASIVPLLLSL